MRQTPEKNILNVFNKMFQNHRKPLCYKLVTGPSSANRELPLVQTKHKQTAWCFRPTVVLNFISNIWLLTVYSTIISIYWLI